MWEWKLKVQRKMDQRERKPKEGWAQIEDQKRGGGGGGGCAAERTIWKRKNRVSYGRCIVGDARDGDREEA